MKKIELVAKTENNKFPIEIEGTEEEIKEFLENKECLT